MTWGDSGYFLSGLKVALQDQVKEQNEGNFREDGEAKLDVLQEETRDMPPVLSAPPGAKRRQTSGVTTALFTTFMQQNALKLLFRE